MDAGDDGLLGGGPVHGQGLGGLQLRRGAPLWAHALHGGGVHSRGPGCEQAAAGAGEAVGADRGGAGADDARPGLLPGGAERRRGAQPGLRRLHRGAAHALRRQGPCRARGARPARDGRRPRARLPCPPLPLPPLPAPQRPPPVLPRLPLLPVGNAGLVVGRGCLHAALAGSSPRRASTALPRSPPPGGRVQLPEGLCRRARPLAHRGPAPLAQRPGAHAREPVGGEGGQRAAGVDAGARAAAQPAPAQVRARHARPGAPGPGPCNRLPGWQPLRCPRRPCPAPRRGVPARDGAGAIVPGAAGPPSAALGAA
mmetsp:Transcript_29711/g.71467  ORF Transcript_29711/g.71467 Transcript_29711/m.71467 type:complete len:312 (+) Transcript_29711:1264-2199(+)